MAWSEGLCMVGWVETVTQAALPRGGDGTEAGGVSRPSIAVWGPETVKLLWSWGRLSRRRGKRAGDGGEGRGLWASSCGGQGLRKGSHGIL